MTSSDLPDDLDTALRRLESALNARVASARSADGQAAEVAELKSKLADAETKAKSLADELAAAEEARNTALKKLDETIGKVDALIAAAGETED